jgi:voltage-gated potassium channel
LRFLRLARLGTFVTEAGQEARRLLVRHRLHYTLVVVVLVIIGGAAAVLAAEDGHPSATITTFGDALWWAITTMTTVGYGDLYPRTPAGRGVAAFLMFSGIAVFGVVTANVASFFFEQEVKEQDDRLDEILDRLTRIEDRLRDPV